MQAPIYTSTTLDNILCNHTLLFHFGDDRYYVLDMMTTPQALEQTIKGRLSQTHIDKLSHAIREYPLTIYVLEQHIRPRAKQYRREIQPSLNRGYGKRPPTEVGNRILASLNDFTLLTTLQHTLRT